MGFCRISGKYTGAPAPRGIRAAKSPQLNPGIQDN